MEILHAPAIEDDDPLPVADEGADPQPVHWPEVSCPTPAEEMFSHAGNGNRMRASFLERGIARSLPGLGVAVK